MPIFALHGENASSIFLLLFSTIKFDLISWFTGSNLPNTKIHTDDNVFDFSMKQEPMKKIQQVQKYEDEETDEEEFTLAPETLPTKSSDKSKSDFLGYC